MSISTAAASSHHVGRPYLMTGADFCSWHQRIGGELVAYYGAKWVRPRDYLAHWPYGRSSYYRYAREFWDKSGAPHV